MNQMNFCNLGKDRKNQKNKPVLLLRAEMKMTTSPSKLRQWLKRRQKRKSVREKNGMKKRQTMEAERKEELESGKKDQGKPQRISEET